MAAERPMLVCATALPGAAGGLGCAAAVAGALARSSEPPGGIVLAELGGEPRRRPTLVSSAPARALESTLRPELPAAARGGVCWVALDAGADWRQGLELCRASGARAVVCHGAPAHWRQLLDSGNGDAAVLRADCDGSKALPALAAADLIRSGRPVAVFPRAPGLVAVRRALAGIEPGGDTGARARRAASRLLSVSARAEAGQALPLVLALTLLLVVLGVLGAVLGVAASRAASVQTAADLAAVSAARSMRDDHARLFLPARLQGGLPNPAHLSEGDYRRRATRAAVEAAKRNGAGDAELAVEFPGDSFAPTRVRVELSGALVTEDHRDEVGVVAVAEAYPTTGVSAAARSALAAGGGYSGPLAYRQGEGMRPDVATAYDTMAAAAGRAGHGLIVNSGFRSDAEQAELFAANPDPRMVARPGTSLHRCATELDLGPTGAYGWLAANAPRFGFVKRYAWEPWHFGYTAGPAPCSRSGDSVKASGRGGDGLGSGATLPDFVPARFRMGITRAAGRWNVPAGLLAAQLLAESNFNPLAVSVAGARGIAQFMPATAAAYGLRNPLDPQAAILAQAHLMSDLLRRFEGRTELALAAYNAGPGPVEACGCVPPYAETQAYVARILGLLGGAGQIAPPQLEVRLVG